MMCWRNLGAKLILFVAGSFIFIPHDILAEDLDEKRLNEISERVRIETENLSNLVNQQDQLEKKLSRLRAQIETAELKESSMIDELASLREQETQNFVMSQTIQERLSSLEDVSLTRMKSMYMWRHKDSALQLLLLAKAPTFFRDSLYLKKVREADLAHMNELSILRTLYANKQKELKSISHEKEKIFNALQLERRQLDLKLRDQERLSEEIKKQQGEVERLLTSLKAESLRLEIVLRSMLVEGAKEKKKRKKSQSSLSFSSPYLEGRGFDSLKGNLEWPSQGKLLRAFGSKSKESFQDFVFSNGIEIQCLEGEKLRAIGPAKVAFIGNLAAYGQVLILDHGKRSYSLYGNLSNILVKQDEVLEAGAAIADCSRKNADKPLSAYLELRKGSKVQNPITYLKSR
ncbi:MAG: peptidoglycan DD-metalloendopeptidase family protein [SAR324 cluster bacterium]|uniref:Peptidoglycan DD-metalloendopeptidase family protein n=1 Tax=SAR324 cluster bacterium TaxID=2024889 RepID=A0A7X9FQT5_9DELT|nr:peptidoglycan DD-metalloendopeptidase family protein [SAR324 cluster bacterium]